MPIETWFPLAIYYADLDDTEEQNKQIKEHVLNLRKNADARNPDHASWTGDIHGLGRVHNDPNFQWLVGQVEQHCIAYLQDLGHNMEKIDLYIQRSWPVISKKNQSIAMHAHYNANISAVYYVEVPQTANPEDAGSFVLHNSSNQNELQEGLGSESTNAISNWNEFNCKVARFSPVAGRLLLFPAHQQHSVEPNQTDDLRLSIAFDIVMTSSQSAGKDSLEFLPPQPDTWKRFNRHDSNAPLT